MTSKLVGMVIAASTLEGVIDSLKKQAGRPGVDEAIVRYEKMLKDLNNGIVPTTAPPIGTPENPGPQQTSMYASNQWWYKELEALWTATVGAPITVDMKRAAFLAMNLMQSVERERTPQ